MSPLLCAASVVRSLNSLDKSKGDLHRGGETNVPAYSHKYSKPVPATSRCRTPFENNMPPEFKNFLSLGSLMHYNHHNGVFVLPMRIPQDLQRTLNR